MTDITVTAAAATFPIPKFLEGWEADSSTSVVHVFKKVEDKTNPGPYDKVELHNFKFLGKTFGSAGYVGREPGGTIVSTHSGAGVCAEFKQLLVAAQRRIYQDFARSQAARGKNPEDETEFAEWCLIKGVHVGWQFRGGNHRHGSAVDIDALFNPYIATGRVTPLPVQLPDKPVGGEKPKGALGASDSAKLESLRLDAINGYIHAVKFMNGRNFEISPGLFADGPRSEPSEGVFNRFALLHEALTWYMSTAMTPRASNTLPLNVAELPRTLDDMREKLRSHINFKLGKTNPELKDVLTDSARLAVLRDQIVADHEAVRKTMLFGTWTISGGKIIDSTTTRDPCNGMLSLRREIPIGIRDAGAFWGASDFGNAESGDIMHFDLRKAIALTQDTNTSRITYAQK